MLTHTHTHTPTQTHTKPRTNLKRSLIHRVHAHDGFLPPSKKTTANARMIDVSYHEFNGFSSSKLVLKTVESG
jgi:hypothetical protein